MINTKRTPAVSLLLFILVMGLFVQPVSARQLTKQELRAMGVYFVSPSSGETITTLSGSVTGTGSCYELALPQINDLEAFAKAIDSYIASKQPKSPFASLGSDIVQGSVKQGVNPMFVVGNMRMESQFGTTGSIETGPNSKNTSVLLHEHFNAFGRTAPGASQPRFPDVNGRYWYSYPSWKDSVNSPTASPTNTTDQPSVMRKVYLNDGLLTIGQYLGRYAPASDGNSESTYGKVVKDVIGSIVILAGSSLSCTDNSTTITPSTTRGGQTNAPI